MKTAPVTWTKQNQSKIFKIFRLEIGASEKSADIRKIGQKELKNWSLIQRITEDPIKYPFTIICPNTK